VKAKNAHYIAIVKRDQPLLHALVSALPWRQVPGGAATIQPRLNPSASTASIRTETDNQGHARAVQVAVRMEGRRDATVWGMRTAHR